LLFTHKFTEAGARDFLKVYDATIAFAGLTSSDKPDQNASEQPDTDEAETDGQDGEVPPLPPPPPPPGNKVKIMAGERELTTGMLAKEASFRLIVSGNIGVKEIERLIQKLEIDKEILADTTDITPELEQ
jgi:hypothetical protein